MSSSTRAALAWLVVLVISFTSCDAAVKPWACTSVCSSNALQPQPANCQQDCPDDVCNPQLADIRGELLVLALGSHGKTGDVTPSGERPSVCCSECQAAEFCNLWRWCSSPVGCGQPGECTRYMQSMRYNSLLPYQRFGPANNKTCTADGRWRQGMCSLMLVQSPADANYKSQGPSSGFVSGMIAAKLQAASGCPVGLTAAACSLCLATKNPASCFSLMMRTYEFQPQNPIPASLAAVCANMSSPKLVATCMWCRTRDATCTSQVLLRHADNQAAAEAAVKCVLAFRQGEVASLATCSK
uniref:Apple domain-containing protein n=1 Tax=Tetradesmus obliquus TaxID=3088 RepID=A0A383VQF4_TETOB|eukprot:jgi/Sobl393_1/17183/SZX66636.1